jgi:hypothetical protein
MVRSDGEFAPAPAETCTSGRLDAAQHGGDVVDAVGSE